MIEHFQMTLPAYGRGFHIITDQILRELKHMPEQGLMTVYIKHTSAGLTINENADPTVLMDFESYFNHIVQERMPFIKAIYNPLRLI